MPRTASAWGWYAEMNDDVRHHLIERGWFGQQQRDHAFEQDVAMQPELDWPGEPTPELDPEFDEEPIHGLYGPSRGAEPEPGDLYGEAAAQPDPPAPEPPQMEPEP